MKIQVVHVWRLCALLIVVVLATAGSCNGDDDAEAVDDLVEQILDDTQSQDLNSGGSETTEASSGVDGGDFQTVYGLPPFGSASLQPGFGEYTIIEDDFQLNENVYFLLADASQEQVIAYYADTLAAAGYEVGPPLTLGESTAISLTMAGDPNITGVVQAGPVSPTDQTLAVNQGRTELKQLPSTTEGDGGGGVEAPAVGADEATEDAN